ncbi:MAG: helix-turn-helix domain-containing protein [Kiritimatiellia bacterium]|nr:helix-turn-helix domain-containing protein [Kiritimatiellia bacterium]MDP6630505.1 helix-turn-helix domain-containing protein [Kiritimatiellia bacterium]MDP6809962.1 helix-turn-helix domain-containing protein [Kiritimatiellia bacterium]MDP7025052.1 helix-turn-helix domain-containing protein [Kiritimatiellia bacterium]
MALGAALKEARMRKKLTASEVASGTRMMVQVVTALEEENFSKIAAPIYAKGFIKLYAEFVGLDPQALVAEYVDRFVEAKPKAAAEPEPEPDLSQRSAAEPELISIPETEPEPKPEDVSPVDEAPPAPEFDLPEQGPAKSDLSGVARSAEPEELDLFSEADVGANDRRGILMDEGYREVEPSWQDRAGHLLTDAVDALQSGADSVGAACRRACGGGTSLVVRTWSRLVDTFTARKKELSQIDFKNLSARHMMALLGVLVLVLLVISSLSRCVRGKGEVALPDAAPSLPVAAEPSDVYLD